MIVPARAHPLFLYIVLCLLTALALTALLAYEIGYDAGLTCPSVYPLHSPHPLF